MKQYIMILATLTTLISFNANAKQALTAVGLAADKAKAELKPYEFVLPEVGEHDLLLDILYGGICHSDIHVVDEAYGPAVEFPYVPGHEIIGRVKQTGSHVTKFKVGDIVGVGSMNDSCGECEFCKKGLEQHCTKGASWTGGGYANKMVIGEHWAVAIPKEIPAEAAAPLMCAGITVYSPIQKMDIQKGDKVAVAGMGGLGHLAVKYLVSMGAEVTVFEITDDKAEAAKKMGVKEYINVAQNKDAYDKHAGKFKGVLDTVPYKHEIQPYLNVLKPTGTLAIVGMPPANDSVVSFDIIPFGSDGKKILGSSIGGMKETEEMVKYSAEHSIFPEVVVISTDEINEAFENVSKGKVQFRYVIDSSTIKK